ncbi:MAG: exonuclease SbcCD subunit D [Chloroflexota bacterium]
MQSSRASTDRERRGAVRFVLSADWQLGMTRHFLAGEAQARYAQARVDAIRTIGRLAAESDALFVGVCGDVFETNRVDPRTVGRTLEALAEVPVPVFLLPGNHDPLDAASVFRSPTFVRGKPDNVTVLDDMEPREVCSGVEVIGAPWTSKRPLHDLVAEVCDGLEPSVGTTRVLLAHGATNEMPAFDNPAVIDVARAEQAIADRRISFVGLGDRHSTTEVGSSGRIWYPGAPEPTDYDEIDPGNALLVEIPADGPVDVISHPVGTWTFVHKSFSLDGPADLDDLESWLASRPAKDRTIVKLALDGTISLTSHARLREMLDRNRAIYAAIEEHERRSDLVVRPDDDDFEDLQLSGFASEAVDALRDAAGGAGDEAETARDALGLLVRYAAAGGGDDA